MPWVDSSRQVCAGGKKSPQGVGGKVPLLTKRSNECREEEHSQGNMAQIVKLCNPPYANTLHVVLKPEAYFNLIAVLPSHLD